MIGVFCMERCIKEYEEVWRSIGVLVAERKISRKGK
jgi:hypothetical protein